MTARPVTTADGGHDPVYIQTDGAEKFSPQDRDFGHIDAEGAEYGASAALGTLVEIIKEFLQDIFSEISRAGKPSEKFTCRREVSPVYGPQQFGPENGHVFGIAAANKIVALVGAGAASDAYIHEEPERAVPVESVLEGIEKNLFPVLGQIPVLIGYRPRSRIWIIEDFKPFGNACITVGALLEFNLIVHPGCSRRFISYLYQFFRIRHIRHFLLL